MEILEPPSLGYGGALYAATITATYTVSDSNDPAITSPLFLDLLPSGAERDVEFPRPGQPLDGRVQYVRNNAAAGGYTLRIRAGTSASATLSTIATLQPTESCICVYRQDPADSIWKLYVVALGYRATAGSDLTLTGLLTAVGITNNSTLDQNGNIDHDTTQAASGAGLDTLAQVSSATGSPDAVVVGLTQITNNRTAGTATAVDITVTGRAGDTSGGTYEFLRTAFVSAGGSAVAIGWKVVAGLTRLIDLTDIATGEGVIALKDAIADALSVKVGSTFFMKFVTTTNAYAVAVSQRLTTTDGVASGTERKVGGLAYSATAAVTLTNSAVETTLGSYTIPANTLKAGTSLRFRAAVRVTGNAAADTLTFRGKLGSTAILTSSAVAMIANDIAIVDGTVTARAVPGAAAEVASNSRATLSVAGTFASVGAVPAPSNFATNGALVLALTGQWNATSAADIAICDQFDVWAEG